MADRINASQRIVGATVVALTTLSLALPGWAGKPEWAGQGKGHEREAERRPGVAVEIKIGGYFGTPQRDAVRSVYAAELQGGRCPPGLAKKHNGCRPPGLTKSWTLGQPLPPGVTVYPIPRELQRRLGEPPPGYRLVRVGADILLIAVGTAMVVDAIEDLAGLL
ncbi:MAG: RcnB family protein [Tepidimonas ignava]|uniref:RcnB family protein n=1 Tax=Tepidimonas ignava TaxID=114249 RepID=UPI002A2B989C|nr:RcnB family protein [Tepidimonas ignava]